MLLKQSSPISITSILRKLNMKSLILSLNTLEDTKEAAKNLLSTLKGGEVILASGDLGCGKTTFFQFLGKEAGVSKTINSPTFNLLKIYQGSIFTFYHADYYRLENATEESKDIGLEEVVGDENTITYIEWPCFASKSILNYHPQIRLNFSYENEGRKLVIEDER